MPLHLSIQYGNLEATKNFVEKGADLNKANKNGDTPLRLAARNGKEEFILYFRELGFDINNPQRHCSLL
jgi:ankyrin repeat protein